MARGPGSRGPGPAVSPARERASKAAARRQGRGWRSPGPRHRPGALRHARGSPPRGTKPARRKAKITAASSSAPTAGAQRHPQDLGPTRPGEIQKEGYESRRERPQEKGRHEEHPAEPQLGEHDAPQRQRARHEGAGGRALQTEVGALGGHDGDGRQHSEEAEIGGPEAAREEKGGEELQGAPHELREKLHRAAARGVPGLVGAHEMNGQSTSARRVGVSPCDGSDGLPW